VTCAVCGRGARRLIAEDVLPCRSAVYRCSGCGIDFLSSRLEDNYWNTAGQEAIYEDAAIARERAAFFEQVLDEIALLCPVGSLLDAGAGKGEFAAAAHSRGWAVSVVEPSVRATAGLAGRGILEVFNVRLEDYTPARQYDCVTLMDVLEHMRDPLAAVRKCALFLRPGGLLVVLTPDGGSFMRSAALAGSRCIPRLGGALKYQYYPPHLCYVSARGFGALARRSGLEVIRIDRTATPKQFLLAKLRHHYGGHAGNRAFCAAVSAAYPLARLGLGNKLLAFARKPV